MQSLLLPQLERLHSRWDLVLALKVETLLRKPSHDTYNIRRLRLGVHRGRPRRRDGRHADKHGYEVHLEVLHLGGPLSLVDYLFGRLVAEIIYLPIGALRRSLIFSGQASARLSSRMRPVRVRVLVFLLLF